MRLSLEGLVVEIDQRPIVWEADLVAEPGESIGLVGPNGCGKSTLLRSIYRVLRPVAGFIHLGGDDVWRLPAREAARRTAVVAQESPQEFDFTVTEVVSMGRTPLKGVLDRESREDRHVCADALARVGMAGTEGRPFTTLSGGEKQRVLIARALAQQSRLLLLDEPTNHLDVRYQLEVLHLVRGLGLTTIAAIHDLDLAARFCDRLYVMAKGRLVASGPPAEVLSDARIAEVFGVRAYRWVQPETGRLHFSFERLDAGLPTEDSTDHMIPAAVRLGPRRVGLTR